MEPKVNDFSIRVATVNGTGSQSSNTILFKSIFRMGIGVCGKNLFPSNIQGLPTWFQIRVSQKGYQNLREKDDIAVLMNKVTALDDIEAMGENTTIVFNSDTIKIPEDKVKKGMNLYPLPVEKLATKISNAKLRTLLKNLFYVGALSHLYQIDEEVIRGVIRDTFASKEKAIEANLEALQIGLDFAKENFKKQDHFELKAGNVNEGKIILDGNSATALGSAYGGCTVIGWYPITPSSSVAESAISYFKKLRHDSDGKAKYAIVQAEDELASAGMIIGAGWCGARAMTATSGPGISLMSEFIGLAYYAEVPCVFVDVQRVGPSTGLPTRTQQGDVQMCAVSSHGDTKHILLFPSTLNECFELTQEAFNLADRFQTPVFLMTDLDLGMNNWVDDEFKYNKPTYDRGKVLTDEDVEKLENFGRYQDVDGDGICYRTLPGLENPKGVFFTRGSGHDEKARYTESPVAYENNMDRLLKKWNTSKQHVPKPVISGDSSSKLGIIAYGTTHHAVAEAIEGHEGSIRYLKLLGYPFSDEVEQFIKDCDQVMVIEQNRDGQLHQLLTVDLPGYQNKVKSVRYYGGFPISSDFVEREIKKALG